MRYDAPQHRAWDETRPRGKDNSSTNITTRGERVRDGNKRYEALNGRTYGGSEEEQNPVRENH